MITISGVKKFSWSLVASSLFLSFSAQADYSKHELADKFIQDMVEEHQFTAEEVTAILAKAEKKQSILDLMSRPAEKTKPWKDYRNIFIGERRISQGVEFWQDNKVEIQKASES